MMKAVICPQYGNADVLEIKELPIPVVKPNDILVRNHAASMTRADAMMRQGTPKFARLFLGFKGPKNPVIGTGFAGVVEAVGSEVDDFNIGDEVYGETSINFSANAEYVCVHAANDIVLPLPKGIALEEAAPICDGALTSYNFLVNVGELKSGQHVLINGASGSLGTSAVQIAKSLGATVTGVCSEKNHNLVKLLGADYLIDYKETDFTKESTKYDLVYDTIGESSFAKCKNVLKEEGRFITPVLSLSILKDMLKTSLWGNQKVKFEATGLQEAKKLKKYLNEINELIESHKLKTIIDKTYSIEDVVEAHHYIDSGRKKGNIIMTF
ncbi:NAD(P)-dependent alcohol dehydrogenase [Sediminitomix flava]|uniref:NADPH:quinone reductase-like Zn-dependent oxidoreductase n=1 Tax=Sediminitomix flava TaxID=379075 RepID=A0A315ZF71_SEDFL|nr:NAD(P)-dependent alcohol dehydrogenase [Sediminitomix flava]PWJ44236.1 NADPH:quinone reductase-like Zn-dependent oxidoreductase [Sediminitomix flava]